MKNSKASGRSTENKKAISSDKKRSYYKEVCSKHGSHMTQFFCWKNEIRNMKHVKKQIPLTELQR